MSFSYVFCDVCELPVCLQLPHRSGRNGFVVDTDELVRQALDSLSELCEFKLAFVVHALTLELEQLTRVSSYPTIPSHLYRTP